MGLNRVMRKVDFEQRAKLNKVSYVHSNGTTLAALMRDLDLNEEDDLDAFHTITSLRRLDSDILYRPFFLKLPDRFLRRAEVCTKHEIRRRAELRREKLANVATRHKVIKRLLDPVSAKPLSCVRRTY